jgi:protein phosphatase
MVLYGHTPPPAGVGQQHAVPRHRLRLRRPLTALRYPRRRSSRFPPSAVWYEPAKPFPTYERPSPQTTTREPDVLDITDVLGKRVVETAHHGRVTVRERTPPARSR